MSEEDPTADEPDQPYMELIAEMFERLRESEGSYVARILQTLEVNKVEARLQRPELPPVFNRLVDDLGMIDRYTVNPAFASRVGEVKHSFDLAEIQSFLARLENDGEFLENLAVMLYYGRLQHEMQTAHPDDRKPAFYLVYNGDGMPIEVMQRRAPRLVKGRQARQA